MKKILVIDDDASQRRVLNEVLKASYVVVEAPSGDLGIPKAVDESPDLILLDLNMPGMHGFSVCSKLREIPRTRKIPIIMLTGDSVIDTRVTGFETGADDFICRPVETRELLARIQARLRRYGEIENEKTTLELGNIVIHRKARQVLLDGKEMRLTATEFELLEYFVQRHGEVIRREKLLSDLWPSSKVEERTVDAHISHLRKKLQDFTYDFSAVYKVGYLLKAKNG